jgi:4-hydroxybenzoate polyprenyltransferase
MIGQLDEVQVSGPRRTARRLGRFTLTRFRPQIYVTYAVLWTLALEGSAVLLRGNGSGWSPSWRTAVRASTVVLVLLFFRMTDEQKDLDYDRVHHPRRPLVTGAITVTELRAAMAAIALLILVGNLVISVPSTLLAWAALGYALLLAAGEARSARLRDGLLINLAFAYASQLIVSGYLYLSLVDSGSITADWRAVPLSLMFAGVFLHFEFARKTAWRDEPGERLYSATVLGPLGSGIVTLALAAVGIGLELTLFTPWRVSGSEAVAAWLPCATLLFPALGGWLFFVRRRPSWPVIPAMCFILGCYLALVIQAAT